MSGLRTIFSVLSFCLLAACASTSAPVTAEASGIVAAIADTRRPEEERARDAVRKPAETLAFAEMRPGARVADLFPGNGYFTRLFSVAVGETGKVYAVIRPRETATQFETPIIPVLPAYANATLVRRPFEALEFPEPLDVVFTAQNYHDFHIPRYNFEPAAINRSVFAALKHGGIYVIVDHAAVAGSGLSAPETLHRIDEAAVRREVQAAGFVFEARGDFLANPADARTAVVFDPSVRGHTDQFALRFRKPR